MIEFKSPHKKAFKHAITVYNTVATEINETAKSTVVKKLDEVNIIPQTRNGVSSWTIILEDTDENFNNVQEISTTICEEAIKGFNKLKGVLK